MMFLNDDDIEGERLRPEDFGPMEKTEIGG